MDIFATGLGSPLGQPPGQTVSLIIPCFNEASRLRTTIPKLRAEFEFSPGVEVVFVDDGSRDGTPEVVAAHIRGWPDARLIRLPWNQGKGSAVKAGVAMARGDRLVFMDADLSADLADLPRLVISLDHADVALGSRSIAGSRVSYAQGRGLRKAQSKIFNGVACAMAGVLASDTQCGFKAFRADSAKLLFHLVEGKGFAFDVEVLALAQLLELRIVEVPVRWVEAEGTTVRPIRAPLLMLRDLMRTRRRCLHLERVAGRFVWEGAEATQASDRLQDQTGATTAELLVADGARDMLIDLSVESPESETVL